MSLFPRKQDSHNNATKLSSPKLVFSPRPEVSARSANVAFPVFSIAPVPPLRLHLLCEPQWQMRSPATPRGVGWPEKLSGPPGGRRAPGSPLPSVHLAKLQRERPRQSTYGGDRRTGREPKTALESRGSPASPSGLTWKPQRHLRAGSPAVARGSPGGRRPLAARLLASFAATPPDELALRRGQGFPDPAPRPGWVRILRISFQNTALRSADSHGNRLQAGTQPTGRTRAGGGDGGPGEGLGRSWTIVRGGYSRDKKHLAKRAQGSAASRVHTVDNGFPGNSREHSGG